MNLPPDYMAKQARWIKRMQKAGVFPPSEPVPDPPPKGAWRMTSQPDGTVFVEFNDVLLPFETAVEIMRLMERQP